MPKKNYENMWHELKEELLADYPFLVRTWGYTTAEMSQVNEILRRMDELDGTHEFSNLLHDMKMEDK